MEHLKKNKLLYLAEYCIENFGNGSENYNLPADLKIKKIKKFAEKLLNKEYWAISFYEDENKNYGNYMLIQLLTKDSYYSAFEFNLNIKKIVMALNNMKIIDNYIFK
jgi:hypothetical protein